MSDVNPPVSGHFLSGATGALAAVLWRPPSDEPVRFGVLHVPAAGDELNKSRRMAAIQARELARRGAIVAVVDLRGVGDSAGEHIDATWSGWCEDVETAWAWLRRLTGPVPAVLWGLRLGGLLATDLVSSRRIEAATLLLWQPVVAGRIFFGQWLRVATTQQITGRGDSVRDAKSLRNALASGSPVEVAGYGLSPELVLGAEAVDLATVAPPPCPVLWRETTIASPTLISPAAAKVQATWCGHQALLDFAAVRGPSFWASQELAEAPELIAATTDALVDCVATVEVIR